MQTEDYINSAFMEMSQLNDQTVGLCPALPSRSRLNSIEPVGVGSSLVESLTSYVTRLAGSHCLPIGVLMKAEIAPAINKNLRGRKSKQNL